jgi:hypothetical protein
MKKNYLLIICLLTAFSGMSQDRRSLQERYEEFRRQAQESYEDFRRQANEEYARFMREAWEHYQAMPAIPAPVTPDPPRPPVTLPEEEQDKTPEDKPLPYEEVIPPPVIIEQPKPVAPVREVPEPQEEWFGFTLFGTACKVRLSDAERFSLSDSKETTVSNAWEQLSQPRYNNLIRDCLELRIRLNLCDWAYLQLLQQLSSDFFGASTNEATLLTAFLYNQSGYKARLAYSGSGRLRMLFSSRHFIYEMNYYRINEDYFYPLNSTETDLHIYTGAFPGEQDLSLNIGKEQLFAVAAGEQRKLESKRYPEVAATVSSNRNLIEFFNTYPKSIINNDVSTKWTFYANTPLSQTITEALYPVLKKAVKDKSEQEAADILLNFVQTAFVYGYDNEIWGGDRPFFADETIYYPYSDCEDRAILFSRLIRDLMGLKVVLIYYPSHMATAVRFNDHISGDYLSIDDKRFIVCDPTFIGAGIGRTMTGMDNNEATVIYLD